MAENTNIEWCDHTDNFWWGCEKVHEGCDNCYAEYQSEDMKRGTKGAVPLWGADAPRRFIKSSFSNLSKWNAQAFKEGKIATVFVGSMMDIFEKPKILVDASGKELTSLFGNTDYKMGSSETYGFTTGDVRDRLFDMICGGYFTNIRFLFLTKRPSNINKYIPPSWGSHPIENIWYGTSVSNQKTANTLLPKMLGVRGNTFVSIEPMINEIDLTVKKKFKNWIDVPLISCTDWVIVGGESGKGKRPFNPDWARNIQSVCSKNNTPFFMKQWDKIIPIPEDLLQRELPWE